MRDTIASDLGRLCGILRRDWLVVCVTLAVLIGGLLAVGMPPMAVLAALVVTPFIVVVGIIIDHYGRR